MHLKCHEPTKQFTLLHASMYSGLHFVCEQHECSGADGTVNLLGVDEGLAPGEDAVVATLGMPCSFCLSSPKMNSNCRSLSFELKGEGSLGVARRH
jgi:hypothetical protein